MSALAQTPVLKAEHATPELLRMFISMNRRILTKRMIAVIESWA